MHFVEQIDVDNRRVLVSREGERGEARSKVDPTWYEERTSAKCAATSLTETAHRD